jgi:predicted DNA-binding protein (MmcQ/YjbR family)
MIGAPRTSEALVNFYQTIRRYNPQDSHLRTHRRENLRSYLKKSWVLVGSSLGRKNRRNDTIKTDHRQIVCNRGTWLEVTEHRVQRWHCSDGGDYKGRIYRSNFLFAYYAPHADIHTEKKNNMCVFRWTAMQWFCMASTDSQRCFQRFHQSPFISTFSHSMENGDLWRKLLVALSFEVRFVSNPCFNVYNFLRGMDSTE